MPGNASSEKNLYLFLMGMIFDNAVKASVHGDVATECQCTSKNLTSEHIPLLSKPHVHTIFTIPQTPMKTSGFFLRSATYVC